MKRNHRYIFIASSHALQLTHFRPCAFNLVGQILSRRSKSSQDFRQSNLIISQMCMPSGLSHFLCRPSRRPCSSFPSLHVAENIPSVRYHGKLVHPEPRRSPETQAGEHQRYLHGVLDWRYLHVATSSGFQNRCTPIIRQDETCVAPILILDSLAQAERRAACNDL